MLLLYNPASGIRKERRRADIEGVVKILREAGIDVTANTSGGPEGALEQVRGTAAKGFDAVFACGGDGTIHDVLQGLVGSHLALGIIPVGTANTLAHDIGLPLHPLRAARALLEAAPLRLPVGQVQFRAFDGTMASRYFTVAVGIGVDAHLFYKLNAAVKNRMGMAAYYAKATHLWFTHRMQFFHVEYAGSDLKQPRQDRVSELLAVRIAQFGGVLRKFAPGAALKHEYHQIVLFKTASRLLYLASIVRGLLGAEWKIPKIEVRGAAQVTCRVAGENEANSERIFVEADGELVGTLPAEISIVKDAFTLLVPPEFL